jgi:predicted nucleic acid-binding protein
MQMYFADAWYFIGLLDRRDSHHRQANRLASRLATTQIVTHDAVLTEFLAFFSDEGISLRRSAAEMTRDVLRTYEVVIPDRPLFLHALDLYESRPDKEYSLVDCMSMVIMKQRGITDVLTNDHHFRQEGFTVVSE